MSRRYRVFPVTRETRQNPAGVFGVDWLLSGGCESRAPEVACETIVTEPVQISNDCQNRPSDLFAHLA